MDELSNIGRAGPLFPGFTGTARMNSLMDDSGDEFDSEGEFTAFDIQLGPSGSEGSGFHTRSDIEILGRRDRIINREGAVSIRGSCVDIVHGLFSEDEEVFCTLLVLEFWFDPRKRARRIAQVDIELKFSGIEPGADPEVYAVAPDGRFSVAETSQKETSAFESGVHIGGGAPGFKVGGSTKYSRNVERERTYSTTVTGSPDIRGRTYGKPNSVSWTLMENPATKTGVPSWMKTVILLKRRDEEEFQCAVYMKAETDWRTSMERLVGSTRPGRAWRINPKQDSTSENYTAMELKLGELNLDSMWKVEMIKTMKKTRKDGIPELE